jgi:hypothetical protein
MRRTEHLLLLIWLLTTGLIAVGAYVLVDRGVLQYLIETDRSFVSVIVMAMYLGGLGHSLARTWRLSCELNRLAETERALAGQAGAPVTLVNDDLVCGGATLPRGFLQAYVSELIRSGGGAPTNGDTAEPGADLLDAHSVKWRGENEFGWFLIDLILKVGFLGTLVGFIWMLASVSQHPVVDASSMQIILREMSFGMSTALNTTLSSLVCGILLSLPYYALGRGLEELLETTLRLSRVEILPRMLPAAPGG